MWIWGQPQSHPMGRGSHLLRNEDVLTLIEDSFTSTEEPSHRTAFHLLRATTLTIEESSAVVRMSSVLMGLAYVSHILRPTSSHIVLVSHLPGYNNSACPSLELIAPKVHLWSMGNLVTTLHLCIYKHGQRLSFRPASLITTQSNAHWFIWNGSGGTKSVDWIITSKLRQAKLVANKLEPK